MTNTLKFYVRLDQAGKVISGTGVWRKKMPSAGRWKEFNGNTCCGPVVSITATPTAPGMLNVTVTITCDGDTAAVFTLLASETNSLEELVDLLNSKLDYLGHFVIDGNDIKLELLLDIAQNLCSDTTLVDYTITGTTTTTTTAAP